MTNILLSGMPRSGTTLLTALMDTRPNTVALNEPKWQYDWAADNRGRGAWDFVEYLEQDFAQTRRKLLEGTPIPERRREDGAAVTNYYQRDASGAVRDTFKVIGFTRKGLSPDFALAMKHNGLYMGVLPELVQSGKFKVMTIIRNPVDVIYSWTRAPIPPAEGKLPGASLYWMEMEAMTLSDRGLLERQVQLYDMLCLRLQQLEKKINVIVYEALVREPLPFTRLFGIPDEAAHRLVLNQKANIPDTERYRIEEAVNKYGKYYLRYYPYR